MSASPHKAALTGPTRSTDLAAQAWALMQQFVDSHDRHGELAHALGFRLGAGRGKALLQLRNGAMTLTELADALRVDAPYATLIVDKLETHGLVERRLHPDDRRRKLVTLTSAGRDAIATADAILLRPPHAVRDLPTSDLRLLIELLEHLTVAGGPDGPDR